MMPAASSARPSSRSWATSARPSRPRLRGSPRSPGGSSSRRPPAMPPSTAPAPRAAACGSSSRRATTWTRGGSRGTRTTTWTRWRRSSRSSRWRRSPRRCWPCRSRGSSAGWRSAWHCTMPWSTAGPCGCSCRRGPRPAVATVTFDRAVVAIPGGEELARCTLRKYAPNLPLASNLFPSAPIKLPRRTFTITAKHIHHLKQCMSGQTTSGKPATAPMPSSFVAIAALAWASFVRSKHPDAIATGHDVYLFFFIDCRGRPGIDPPVSENYFGTCITGCLVKAMARDLLVVDGVAVAMEVIQREVQRAAEDPLDLWDWMDIVSWVPLDRLVGINGSTRFKAYEVTDFGWGAPSRTEVVTMSDGRVGLVTAKSGGVQASVCMHPDHARSFNSHFLDFLG